MSSEFGLQRTEPARRGLAEAAPGSHAGVCSSCEAEMAGQNARGCGRVGHLCTHGADVDHMEQQFDVEPFERPRVPVLDVQVAGEFAEERFDVPAVVVQVDQVGMRERLGIQQRRDQPDRSEPWPLDPDDANHHRLGNGRVLPLPVALVGANLVQAVALDEREA